MADPQRIEENASPPPAADPSLVGWLGEQKQAGPFCLALVVLGLVGLLIYAPGLRYPFVFDDLHAITHNPTITKLWPFFGAEGPLAGPIESPTAGRPLVNLSLAINYRLGQLDTLGYHVVNLVVHVLAALTLWALVRRTLQLPYFAGRFDRGASSVALLIALVWLAHPLQTESVQYVTQRTELLVSLCYFATLYSSLRYCCATTSTERAVWLTVAAVACLLGMMCKEVMVTAPVVVLLYERTFLTGSFWQALRRSWPLYSLLALSWLLLLWLNLDGPRKESAGFHLSIPAHAWWFTQAKVLAMYGKLVVWPWPLSIHYHVPLIESLSVAWPWVALVALLAVATLVLVARGSAIGFLGAFAFIVLSPTLVVPVIKEYAVERRMYLALAAILTLLIAGGYALLQAAARRWTASADSHAAPRWPLTTILVGCSLVAIVLSFVSAQRITAYQDAVTLWQDAARHDPDDEIAATNAGRALNDAGRYREAIESLQQFLERHPDSADGHHSLALALLNVNRSDEALEHLKLAVDGPDPALVQFHMGVALTNLERPAEAVPHFRLAAQELSDVADIQNRLALALTLTGNFPDAIEPFRRALELDPNSTVIHTNFGLALKEAGRLDEAIHELKEAVRLAPNDLDARIRLAIVYAELGQSTAATATAEDALKLARIAGNAGAIQFLENWLAERRKRD